MHTLIFIGLFAGFTTILVYTFLKMYTWYMRLISGTIAIDARPPGVIVPQYELDTYDYETAHVVYHKKVTHALLAGILVSLIQKKAIKLWRLGGVSKSTTFQAEFLDVTGLQLTNHESEILAIISRACADNKSSEFSLADVRIALRMAYQKMRKDVCASAYANGLLRRNPYRRGAGALFAFPFVLLSMLSFVPILFAVLWLKKVLPWASFDTVATLAVVPYISALTSVFIAIELRQRDYVVGRTDTGMAAFEKISGYHDYLTTVGIDKLDADHAVELAKVAVGPKTAIEIDSMDAVFAAVLDADKRAVSLFAGLVNLTSLDN